MSADNPVIWQISVVQFELGTSITGVALAKMYSSTSPEQFFSRQFFAVMASFSNKSYSRKDLFLLADKNLHAVTTSRNGKFNLWLEGIGVNEIKVYADNNCGIPVPIIQSYPFYFPLGNQSVEIISDIDDTILLSYTNTFLRRVLTILFTAPKARKIVGFTDRILTFAKEAGVRVYCVSRSEMNLFHLIARIFVLNKINNVVIDLFDYSTILRLINARKGHFKFDQICSIFQKSPGKRYYLLGDDIQSDIRIYCEIAEKFPGRVCGVFIHRTKSFRYPFQKMYYERLSELKIPVLYFDDQTQFEKSMLNMINS